MSLFKSFQVPQSSLIISTKWKSCRAVEGAVNPPSGVWGQMGTMPFRPLQHFKWLNIDRITSRKIRYWKDFFQQNRSSSTFIKQKKGHVSVAESHWGGKSPLYLIPQGEQYLYWTVKPGIQEFLHFLSYDSGPYFWGGDGAQNKKNGEKVTGWNLRQ